MACTADHPEVLKPLGVKKRKAGLLNLKYQGGVDTPLRRHTELILNSEILRDKQENFFFYFKQCKKQ